MLTFPDEVFAADAVIVSGPPMTGEYRLFHELLARLGDERIVISSGTDAATIRNDHDEIIGDETAISVIDCITAGRAETPRDDDRTKYVDSPGNLTSIGVKVTQFLEALEGTEASAVVGVHSISELLMHAELEQTYQFIHILAQQTARAGWPLLASMNAQSHDDQTRNAISTRFDCILETRTADGRNEFRVRTAKDEPSAWTPIVPVES